MRGRSSQVHAAAQPQPQMGRQPLAAAQAPGAGPWAGAMPAQQRLLVPQHLHAVAASTAGSQVQLAFPQQGALGHPRAGGSGTVRSDTLPPARPPARRWLLTSLTQVRAVVAQAPPALPARDGGMGRRFE